MSGKGRRRNHKGKSPSSGSKTSHNDQKQQGGRDRSVAPDSLSPEEASAAFERELVWCIQQIEMGLTSAKVKQGGRQVEDAMKILKILQNPKAPLVKKRQVMRTTFGDYRKKIALEEQQCASDIKKMRLEVADTKKQNKSTFLRKASQPQPKLSNPQVQHPTSDKSIAEKFSNLKFEPSNSDFRFSFPLQPEDASCVTDSSSSPCSFSGTKDDTVQVGAQPAVNFFKMQTSTNAFRFNFTLKDDT